MNLQEMLAKALAKIDAMSPEDFEAECIKAGYHPVRKHIVNMSEERLITHDGMISYKHSVSIKSHEDIEFSLESANDSIFHLAA